MKIVKLEAFMKVDDDAVNYMKRLEHHADYLLDLDSHPEIKSVFGVKVTEVDDESPIIPLNTT